MTATKQWIEDAIEGGYDPRIQKNGIYLEPTAWQAVGKVRGWEAEYDYWKCEYCKALMLPDWKFRWHQFIDHLADGETIEEALTAISV